MIPFRFLHAADLHLDSRFVGLAQLPQAVRSYLRESTFAALGRLVGVAVEEKVDFVVISGDVYDVSDASLQGQLRFQEALRELAGQGIQVYLIHGNHDPLDGPRLNMELPAGVTLFGAGEPGQAVACRRSDGTELAVISGISYPTAKVTENTALRFSRKPGSSLFHIALLHGNVDGDLQHETYSPCTRKDLIGRGFDYWALGHIHKRSILHERPAIVYPGNIQGRSVKETGPKGCYIVDVNEEGHTALRFRELDTVRWQVKEIPIDGLADEAEWTNAVERAVEEIRDELPQLMSVVRFRLTGRGNVHRLLSEKGAAADLLTELQRREAVRAGQQRYAGLVWTEGFSVETGLPVDRERLVQEDSFLGELLRLSGRSGQTQDGLEDLLSAALKPLMENRELRRLLTAIDGDDKRDWLRSAEELGITLLSGAEEAARTGSRHQVHGEEAAEDPGMPDTLIGNSADTGSGAEEW
ncbi:metallophosphoesterase family protein [Paenibacillus typhae]|uniref:DNA repair exonuclease SbcCD nuclease subunit n=1 Tax=Paenibacillus typhae TaxID=1174501 RepID=A0A1G8F3H3_9BACL|nr:DNA repair exonuclease [Paenibacillus typhae]SDH76658.1 DNA repair exonuclease SbcCD nuclease subunit [Paenibacillus typhae]